MASEYHETNRIVSELNSTGGKSVHERPVTAPGKIAVNVMGVGVQSLGIANFFR